jgi:hypothetical protein
VRIDPCAALIVIQREEIVARHHHPGVRGDRLARRDQLFHQRVAEQPDLRVRAEQLARCSTKAACQR